MVVLALIAIFFVVILALWIYARWEHGILEKMGIPIVDHHPILGSIREIYETPGGLNDFKWMKKYGPIFGVYEGRQPQLFVCVPELVRLISVKDADNFRTRREMEFGDPVMNEMPDFIKYDKWKIVRSLTTPAFTTAKIKMMNLPMMEATKDFVDGLKKKIKQGNGAHEKFPVDLAVHTMLTDLISRCVFSVRISSNQDDDNEFARIVRELVTPPTGENSQELIIWSHVFPFIRKFIPSIFKPEPVQRFVKIFKQMLDERRRSGEKRNDVVDMCLEWYEKLDTPEFKSAKVTELTFFAQALVFFFATQDQVSTMVSAVIYQLTQNPKMEQKIYEEVDAIFAKHNGKIEHEHLQELIYLNACINEALRLYSFFHRTERVCSKDWSNEEYGLHIKKGMTVMMPIWAINRNSEYNEKGEEYIPERFMPENKHKLNIYASTAFGHGPRNCTGQRFATEAMPLILAYMLKELKFMSRKDTKLEFIPGGPFMQPHEQILVDIMERK